MASLLLAGLNIPFLIEVIVLYRWLGPKVNYAALKQTDQLQDDVDKG